jgi:hypothetical protein
LSKVKVDNAGVRVRNLSGKEITVIIYGQDEIIKSNDELMIEVDRKTVTLAKVTVYPPSPKMSQES